MQGTNRRQICKQASHLQSAELAGLDLMLHGMPPAAHAMLRSEINNLDCLFQALNGRLVSQSQATYENNKSAKPEALVKSRTHRLVREYGVGAVGRARQDVSVGELLLPRGVQQRVAGRQRVARREVGARRDVRPGQRVRTCGDKPRLSSRVRNVTTGILLLVTDRS